MSVDTNYRAGIKVLLKTEWTSFFATFARFEYAMKRAGYLKHDKPGTSAEAGWSGFAADLGPGFFAACQQDADLAVLLIAPPQLLKVGLGATVDWKKPRAVKDSEDVFSVIKDIRNNLFHGERQVHGDRDAQLIAAAQLALDLAWLTAAKATANPKLAQFCARFRFD